MPREQAPGQVAAQRSPTRRRRSSIADSPEFLFAGAECLALRK